MIRRYRSTSGQSLSRCPRVLSKCAEPGNLVHVLDAVPARKMVEHRELAPSDLFPLVGEIDRDPLSEPSASLRKADLLKIAHEVGARRSALVAGELAAEGEIPAVIQIEFLELERAAWEEGGLAEISGPHRDRQRRSLLEAPDLSFRLAALLRRQIQP